MGEANDGWALIRICCLTTHQIKPDPNLLRWRADRCCGQYLHMHMGTHMKLLDKPLRAVRQEAQRTFLGPREGYVETPIQQNFLHHACSRHSALPQ